jgi:drug/metabolite transporter (DMT)-like permease
MINVSVKPEPSRMGVAAAFASVYIIWGSTYLAIRYALESLPPLLMAGARHTVAGALLYAVLQARVRASAANHWRSAHHQGAVAADRSRRCWAEQRCPQDLPRCSSPSRLDGLLNWLRRGVRPGIMEIGSRAGLVGRHHSHRFGESRRLQRIGWAPIVLIAASLSWALGSIYSRQAPLPKSPLMVTAMQMLCGGVLLLLSGAVSGEGAGLILENVSLRSLVALGYLTVFGSLVAFSAYVWLLRVSTPAKVSTYAFVNPVVAVALGFVFAGEPLTPRTMVAAAVIVAAVVLITRQRRRTTAVPVVLAEADSPLKSQCHRLASKSDDRRCEMKIAAEVCVD